VRAACRVLAANRDLRVVLAAGLVSGSGDWILVAGLLYHVYAMTGSTVASALIIFTFFAPQVLVGPIGGAFADRWDRKLTMIVTDVLLAMGLLPLLAVRGGAQVWVVFVVLVWEGMVQQFFTPAQQAMIPRVVPDNQLVAANGLNGQVGAVSRLAGSALGGLIAAAGGIAGIALVDAGSFVISAAVLTLVRTSGTVERGEAHRSRLLALAEDLRIGLRLSTTHRLLRKLMVFAVITSIGEGIVGTLFAPFFRHVLHGSSQSFGLFLAAQAIGGIAGGAVVSSVGPRLAAWRLVSYGAIGFGVVDLAIFLYPLGYIAVWPAMAGIVLAGLFGALCMAGLLTLFQRNTEDSHRGRVFGALGAADGIAVMAGSLAAGYLTRPFAIIPVIAIQGAGYLIAGLLMTVWLQDDGPVEARQPVAVGPSGPATLVGVDGA
jgi:MFS family permease